MLYAQSVFGVFPFPSYKQGVPKPPGVKYTRTLVVARTDREDSSWTEELSRDADLNIALYTVDKPSPPYMVPENKGNEVMAYLSYIIDFYDLLSDVNIFVHAHLEAWHNNDLLNQSAVEQVRHLQSRTVVRNGYANLRCPFKPGCPAHLHPKSFEDDPKDIPEIVIFAEAWEQILPSHPLPRMLAQPCCAQFAVSRERIRALPREQYVHFRTWLQKTPYHVAGRVWEYLWQYVFTGEAVHCPSERDCYCNNYGLCFESDRAYDEAQLLFWRIWGQKRVIQKVLDKMEGRPEPESQVAQSQVKVERWEETFAAKKDAAFQRGREKEEEEAAP